MLSAAVTAGAKSIFIRSGTYVETTKIQLSTGMQLIGEGRTESIIDFDDSTTAWIDTNDGKHILIQDLQIKKAKTTKGGLEIAASGQMVIRNCYFNDCKRGIFINVSSNRGPVIESCLFTNNDDQDIRFDGGDKNTIVNCFFASTNANVFLDNNSQENIMSNNVFAQTKLQVAGQDNIISNNTFDQVTQITGDRNILQGNLSLNVSSVDAFDISSDNNLILNNIIKGAGGDGIQLSNDSNNNIIQGNRITGCTGFGVNIAASTEDNNILSGNNLAGNTGGAFQDNGTGTQIGLNITS